MSSANDVVTAYNELPPAERREAARSITQSLPPATGNTVNWLWLIVVTTLAILVLGGTYLIYDLVQDSKDTEAILPLVSGAIGLIAGLLAPSPAVDRGGTTR